MLYLYIFIVNPKSGIRKILFHFVRKDTVYLQIVSKLLVFQMIMGDIL